MKNTAIAKRIEDIMKDFSSEELPTISKYELIILGSMHPWYYPNSVNAENWRIALENILELIAIDSQETQVTVPPASYQEAIMANLKARYNLGYNNINDNLGIVLVPTPDGFTIIIYKGKIGAFSTGIFNINCLHHDGSEIEKELIHGFKDQRVINRVYLEHYDYDIDKWLDALLDN